MAKTNASASSSLSNNVTMNECKYKGVWKRKWGKYVSEIRFPNSRQRIWLGSYDTAEKAARAFDAALFLLRGPNAKFNFPDDPPNIAAGHPLTPAEIQAVAQQYGNSFGGSCKGHHKEPEEDTSPTWNSDDDHQIDWSFLDSLELNDEKDISVSSFGVFPESDDMYIAPNFLPSGGDNIDHGGIGDLSSFLWNFDAMEHY